MQAVNLGGIFLGEVESVYQLVAGIVGFGLVNVKLGDKFVYIHR